MYRHGPAGHRDSGYASNLPASLLYGYYSECFLALAKVTSPFLLYRKIEELTWNLRDKEQLLELLSTEKQNLMQCLEEPQKMEVQVILLMKPP